MDSITSFVKGSNLKLNVAALAIAVTATAYLKMRKPMKSLEEETETETKPMPKPMAMVHKYGPYVLVIFLLIPILVGIMNKTPASSFQARVASAASELRDQIEGTPVIEGDFQQRVSEAARKLREEIANKKNIVESGESASSLAAQASAEISKFISENS